MRDARALAVVVIPAVFSTFAAARQQQAPFQAAADTVAIYATVSDRAGHLVTGLGVDDFQVLDDGKPSAVTTFAAGAVPITVALMLDMSGSMMAEYGRVRTAALRFIDALNPDDRMRVGTFGDEVAVSPLLTGDKAVLRRIVAEELWPQNGTLLWVAVNEAMKSLVTEPGRRVVVIITDGDDGCHCKDGSIANLAIGGGFLLYAVSVEERGLSREMTDLITKTGGGRVELARDADLAAACEQIVQELRVQYAIGIAPAHDGKRHTIQVRVRPAGLSVRARTTYQAPGGPS